MFLGIMKVLIL